MSAQDGRQIASAARAAIAAGGMTAAEAQNWIDSLKPYLQYVNLASYFQITIDQLQQIVDAGGQPPVVEKATANNQQSQDSAGQIVVNDQQARVQGATVSNPSPEITAPPNSIDTTLLSQPLSQDQQAYFNQINGRITPDTTLPLSVTQATPPNNINDLANSPIATPSAQTGVGARGDDAAPVTGNTTKDIINATFAKSTNQYIPTQPNVLDDYASYTYQISWYLLTPQQYNNLVFSPKFNVATWSLLAQSGGAPLPTTSNTATASITGSRNPFFNVDYYLDELELFSKLPGKGTGMPHNVVDIKFKVTEPNGLTLIDSLYAAVKAIYGAGADAPIPDLQTDSAQLLGQEAANNLPTSRLAATPNYLTAQYCLGIKFYGYDSGGNLIAPATGKFNTANQNNNKTPVGPSNDPYVIIEKYYPFLISDLKFRMVSRQVEYYVEAKPVSQFTAFGQTRGTIPYNFELSGTTVKDLLIGKTAQSGLQPQQDGRVPQSTPPADKIPPAPPSSDTQQLLQFGTFNAGSSLTYSDTPGIY
jgi:hypothetical protein